MRRLVKVVEECSMSSSYHLSLRFFLWALLRWGLLLLLLLLWDSLVSGRLRCCVYERGMM